jgi:Mce-associated membrane protein
LPDGSVANTYDAGVREAGEGRPVALWALVSVLVLACVVGGVQVAHAHDSRERAAERQQRYADALAAARTEATAFVNVRHDTAEEDLGRIAAGATGPLKDRYVEDADRFVAALRRDKTVTTGSVVWAGVVRVDATGATVLVATTGTRADRTTSGEEVSRDLRLRLELVPVDGDWLTSDIRPVG